MNQQHDYFGEVGMWHKGARHLERTYVLGFIISVVLTLTAYAVSVYGIIPRALLVPVVLILACFQFIAQVLGFLHVSGARSSRNRLLALMYSLIMVLALVLGSMWIMANLKPRMMPEETVQHYMQSEQGI